MHLCLECCKQASVGSDLQRLGSAGGVLPVWKSSQASLHTGGDFHLATPAAVLISAQSGWDAMLGSPMMCAVREGEG